MTCQGSPRISVTVTTEVCSPLFQASALNSGLSLVFSVGLGERRCRDFQEKNPISILQTSSNAVKLYIFFLQWDQYKQGKNNINLQLKVVCNQNSLSQLTPFLFPLPHWGHLKNNKDSKTGHRVWISGTAWATAEEQHLVFRWLADSVIALIKHH